MIEVRDYQYKVIDEKVYLGIELEVSGESYYKNSKIVIEYLKNGVIFQKDDTFVIPMIVGEGIFCLGREIKKEFDFDEMEVSIETGSKEYEETYDQQVEWAFNNFDEKSRVISYKIKNTNKEPLEYAILNLVFFNKGELIAGTNIKLENLLNEREYYFEYKVPNEIEYTEIHPYVILPSTDELLFKGFYEKYDNLQKRILETSKEIPPKEHEEFVDRTDEYQQNIIISKNDLEKIKKMQDQTTTSVFAKNIFIGFKNLFKCIPDLFMKLVDNMDANGFAEFVTGVFGLVLIYGLIEFAYYLFTGNFLRGLVSLFRFGVLPLLIIIGVCYIPYYIYYCAKKTEWIKKKELITLEEKNRRIQEQEARIIKAQETYDEYVNNIDKYKNEVVERNKEIDKENALLGEHNKEVRKTHAGYETSLRRLLTKYTDYRIIESYDEMDWEIVMNAFQRGLYKFEDVEDYRSNVKNKVLEERKKMQEQLRQLEAEKRQEALQQQLVDKLEAVKSEVRYMQQEQSNLARQQLSYAASQAYVNESINRKLSDMKTAQSVNNAYQEAMYYKYH